VNNGGASRVFAQAAHLKPVPRYKFGPAGEANSCPAWADYWRLVPRLDEHVRGLRQLTRLVVDIRCQLPLALMD
jgi:hypothetical protein